MDTKYLYVKSQKNVLSWAIGITAVFLISALAPFFMKYTNGQQNKVDLWVNSITYTFLFSALIYNRRVFSIKIARYALGAYFLLDLYYLTSLIIKTKANLSSMKNLSFMSPVSTLLFAYAATILVLGLMTLLYYKNLKATKAIRALTDIN